MLLLIASNTATADSIVPFTHSQFTCHSLACPRMLLCSICHGSQSQSDHICNHVTISFLACSMLHFLDSFHANSFFAAAQILHASSLTSIGTYFHRWCLAMFCIHFISLFSCLAFLRFPHSLAYDNKLLFSFAFSGNKIWIMRSLPISLLVSL
jgi:hypothetical protein